MGQLINEAKWPPAVWAIYERHCRAIDQLGFNGELEMGYGPAHLVWDDENWRCIQFCLDECEGWTRREVSAEVLAIVRQSLLDLLQLGPEVLDAL